jgi:hypothetical protein
LDTLALGTVPAGQSRGRFADGTSSILPLVPTPGAVNAQTIVDTDGDGIPDNYEIANGLNPNDPADALRDADGDGVTNKGEFLSGTNPQSGGDALRASLINSGGTPAVRFTAAAGVTYTVQFKNDLTDAAWSNLGNVSAQAVTTTVNVPDPTVPAGQAVRFYRVVTPQQP